MKLGFYPGCSLEGSSREYNESLCASASALGIELEAVPDWNCCGATAAHNLNHSLSLALPARILALSQKAKMPELVVPCAACFSRLKVTRHELLENETLREKIAGIIEMELPPEIPQVINIIEMLEKYVMADIDGKIKTPFKHNVACYYGCLLVRPHKILKFDRPEDPQSMDGIMKKIGANPIDWAFKVECCGAGFSVSRTDVVAKLSGQIIEDAVSRGAEAIVVACPMCHSNLDLRRKAINDYNHKKYTIPAIYITQAIGLALGLDKKALGLHRHIVPVKFPGNPGPGETQTQTEA
jgi:heterodisulfide reductase subunit B